MSKNNHAPFKVILDEEEQLFVTTAPDELLTSLYFSSGNFINFVRKLEQSGFTIAPYNPVIQLDFRNEEAQQ